MLKGMEFLLKKSKAFKISLCFLSSLRVKRSNRVTSPLEGEVGAPLRVRGNNKQEGGYFYRCFTSTVNVILRWYSLPEVPRRRIHKAIVSAMSRCVAVGNKVRDTRLPQPAGCGDKYDMQCGRSMIEMLGVLAIIAVLSVGGIAGYSKAMLMWRSNMQKQMISELIAAAIKIRPNLNPKSTEWENLTSVLYAMGDIPEGVTYRNKQMHTKDGICSTLFYGLFTWDKVDGTKGKEFKMDMAFNMSIVHDSSFSPTGKDLCQNIIIVSKQITEINNAIMWVADSESTSVNKTTGIVLYDKRKDKNISLVEIAQRCSQVIKESTFANIWVELQPY